MLHVKVELRKHGMAPHPDDPDLLNLIIVNNESGSPLLGDYDVWQCTPLEYVFDPPTGPIGHLYGVPRGDGPAYVAPLIAKALELVTS